MPRFYFIRQFLAHFNKYLQRQCNFNRYLDINGSNLAIGNFFFIRGVFLLLSVSTVYSLRFIFLLAPLKVAHKFEIDAIVSGCR